MKKRYFGHSYYGEFDSTFNIIWSDNRIVFKHLSAGSKMLLKKLTKPGAPNPYKHIFKSGRVNYCAFIIRRSNGRYSCKIYEEGFDEQFTKDELEGGLNNIEDCSLLLYSLADMIEEYFNRSVYDNKDEMIDVIKEQKKSISSIYCYCQNLMAVFEDKKNEKFIPLQNYILRTWDIVQHITRKLDKSFSIHMDILLPYIKIDYKKFELALYNLMKLILIYSIFGDEPVITIKSTSLDSISVSVDFTMDMNYELSNHLFEIKAVKYLFKKMNGNFTYSISKKRMYMSGEIKAESSYDSTVVNSDLNIDFIDDPELVIRKRTSNRYINIYERTKIENELEFASEKKMFSDIDEPEVIFAKQFFGDICDF